MPKVMIRELEKLDFRTKEAYKTLRTNLSFTGKDFRVISLTSCTPNEGKTSVSFQLALSLAEDGKKTVLVDADLRRSASISRTLFPAFPISCASCMAISLFPSLG